MTSSLEKRLEAVEEVVGIGCECQRVLVQIIRRGEERPPAPPPCPRCAGRRPRRISFIIAGIDPGSGPTGGDLS